MCLLALETSTSNRFYLSTTNFIEAIIKIDLRNKTNQLKIQ